MKKTRARLISSLLCLVFFAACMPLGVMAETTSADSVYLNGNIYTVDSNFSKATAIAVKGQNLIYVGNDKDVKKLIGKETKVVDLMGRTVVPGLIEGHMHFPGFGEKLLQIDAFWKPKADILAAVKAEADRLPDGDWIVGRGWNQEVWAGSQFPSKEDLDAVAPNNPVALTRTCGHALWVNSKAIEIGGITKDTPNPVGGEILKDKSGNVLGVLTDTAMNMVRGKIPEYSEARKKEAYIKGQQELFSYGFTTVMDAGSGSTTIKYIKDLYEENKMDIRIYGFVNSGDSAKEYYKQGPQIGLYDNRLTLRGIKFFSDGSLGARSAWMLAEYSDRVGHLGNGRYTNDEFYALIKEARENGFQVATHAIGDAAVRQCVDIYEKVLKEQPLADHRYRIEHYQVSTIEDIERIAKIGIIPAMQSVHATSDKNMAEDRVGAERIKGAYAWRKVIDKGSVIVNGSDAPVELVNPYHGLYAAVTRMDRDGNPTGGWYSEECMTREEALKSFTIWAAYGQFEEKLKGSLEVGKLADFAVIDRDVMTCPASDIKDANALMTVVGGKVVYTRPENKQMTVMVKGTPLKAQPVIEKNVIYLQAKETLEAMGLKYQLSGSSLEITKDFNKITIKADSKTVRMFGIDMPAEAAAKTINGVLYIPETYACDFLGYNIMMYIDSNILSINF